MLSYDVFVGEADRPLAPIHLRRDTMGFDAWNGLMTIGGAGALAYLVAGQKSEDEGTHNMRLSLTKDNALLTDVRVLGGLGALGASMFVKDGSAKHTLHTAALVLGASVVTTELIRWRLSKADDDGRPLSIAGDGDTAPLLPQWLSAQTDKVRGVPRAVEPARWAR